MSHVEHERPRAYEAACKVDPMILAGALDHIAKTAERSRSQSRRVRWIKARAEAALAGNDHPDAGVDLPRNVADTVEKMARRMAYHIAIKHQLLQALQKLRDSDGFIHLLDSDQAVIEDAIAAAGDVTIAKTAGSAD